MENVKSPTAFYRGEEQTCGVTGQDVAREFGFCLLLDRNCGFDVESTQLFKAEAVVSRIRKFPRKKQVKYALLQIFTWGRILKRQKELWWIQGSK